MSIEIGDEVEVQKRVLVSTAAASRLIGCARETWPRIAEANGIQAIPTGKRNLWRKADVERLISGSPTKESA